MILILLFHFKFALTLLYYNKYTIIPSHTSLFIYKGVRNHYRRIGFANYIMRLTALLMLPSAGFVHVRQCHSSRHKHIQMSDLIVHWSNIEVDQAKPIQDTIFFFCNRFIRPIIFCQSYSLKLAVNHVKSEHVSSGWLLTISTSFKNTPSDCLTQAPMYIMGTATSEC